MWLLILSLATRASAQDTHLLVITGVSGDEEHAKKFHDLAVRFIDAAKKNDGVADERVTYLAEKPEADPQRIRARSTRENVSKAFADIAARAHPNDEIFVLLIGHGSSDSRGGMFNLPGPDLTADDYAKLLAKWPTQRVAFVNTASASGAFLPAVAGPGRTIVTATKTGGEKNETRFATYFVEAYESQAADRDRNGRVSVLEAFDYAKAKVVKAFEQEGTLLTEHATLDDGSEGKVAATLFLAPAEGRAEPSLDMTNPAIRDLVRERDALEQQIAGLKLRKADMDPTQYEQELEKLLLALAEKSRALQLAEKSNEREDTMSLRRRLATVALVVAAASVSLVAQRRLFERPPVDFAAEKNTDYDGRFAFARLKYNANSPRAFYYCGLPPWAHGYASCRGGQRAETSLMRILNEVSYLGAHVEEGQVLGVDDPELFKYPVAYMTEAGFWQLSDAEAAAFRAYLQKGGFVIFDDFRGDFRGGGGWENFAGNMERVLPGVRFVDMQPSHPIFHAFFEIDSFDVIPQSYDAARPEIRGIFENNDPAKRLMAIINYNTDVSDFWEFSATGFRPIDESNQAYKLGVNYIMYGLTH